MSTHLDLFLFDNCLPSPNSFLSHEMENNNIEDDLQKQMMGQEGVKIAQMKCINNEKYSVQKLESSKEEFMKINEISDHLMSQKIYQCNDQIIQIIKRTNKQQIQEFPNKFNELERKYKSILDFEGISKDLIEHIATEMIRLTIEKQKKNLGCINKQFQNSLMNYFLECYVSKLILSTVEREFKRDIFKKVVTKMVNKEGNNLKRRYITLLNYFLEEIEERGKVYEYVQLLLFMIHQESVSDTNSTQYLTSYRKKMTALLLLQHALYPDRKAKFIDFYTLWSHVFPLHPLERKKSPSTLLKKRKLRQTNIISIKITPTSPKTFDLKESNEVIKSKKKFSIESKAVSFERNRNNVESRLSDCRTHSSTVLIQLRKNDHMESLSDNICQKLSKENLNLEIPSQDSNQINKQLQSESSNHLNFEQKIQSPKIKKQAKVSQIAFDNLSAQQKQQIPYENLFTSFNKNFEKSKNCLNSSIQISSQEMNNSSEQFHLISSQIKYQNQLYPLQLNRLAQQEENMYFKQFYPLYQVQQNYLFPIQLNSMLIPSQQVYLLHNQSEIQSQLLHQRFPFYNSS